MVRFTSASPSTATPADDLTKPNGVSDNGVDSDKETDSDLEDVDDVVLFHDKRVVFRGTYPIDRPILGPTASTLTKRQQMTLNLKHPRTFPIEEPILPPFKLVQVSNGQQSILHGLTLVNFRNNSIKVRVLS